MNIDMNNLDEPRLTPPQVVYPHKAALKKTAVIPLYVKVASAAAAVALLVTLCWPRPERPVLELAASLKPLAAKMVVPGEGKIVSDAGTLVADAGTLVAQAHQGGASEPSQDSGTGRPEGRPSTVVSNPSQAVAPVVQMQPRRTELTLLASLPPAVAPGLALAEVSDGHAVSTAGGTETIAILPQSSLAEAALAWTPEGAMHDDEAESLLERGFLRMTDGTYAGFGDMLRQGWRTVKVELAQLNESVGEGFHQLKQIPPPPSFHSASDF